MLINEQTKIGALLKHNPEALEAIIPLSADFTRLRNPILRKLMAGRTTIAMASKIGGCTPTDFFEALRPLGFDVDTQHQPASENSTGPTPLPTYLLQANAGQIIELDVRSMLAAGNNPLRLIQQKIKELDKGQILKIINTFEPTPLINLLSKQGFESHVKVISSDLIETYFYSASNFAQPQVEAVPSADDEYDSILQQYKDNLREIDVRHLEMPLPMTTILESLNTLPKTQVLYVHHKRVPVFLLTELKDRGLQFRMKEIEEGQVDLLIYRD